MVAEALRDLLAATASVTTGLATYDFGGASPEPAIFTVDPIPHDASLPAVVITEVGGGRWGTRTKKGADVNCDVRVWGDKDRSRAALRDLAWTIWGALERADLSISGYSEAGCRADAPQELTDPDGFPGFLIPVAVRILQI